MRFYGPPLPHPVELSERGCSLGSTKGDPDAAGLPEGLSPMTSQRVAKDAHQP